MQININSLKSISIHQRQLIDTQRDIPNTQQSLTQFEMTQQNVIRYTTTNCSQYATESLDTQQKIACGNFRDYGEFSCISLY